MRFCHDTFFPFDPYNLHTCDCSLDPRDPSEMPSFESLANVFNFSNSELLNFYLKSNDIKVEVIWDQIDDAIATTILKKSKSILRYVGMQKSITNNRTGKSFQLLRFDFLIDDNLKVHLLEANMSPTLSFDGVDKEKNENTARQLLRDTFKIVGAGSYNDLREER